jgi:hypothetical protein
MHETCKPETIILRSLIAAASIINVAALATENFESHDIRPAFPVARRAVIQAGRNASRQAAVAKPASGR